MEIARPVYLEKLLKKRENGMVKVITGIRRCGKSYLLGTLYGDHLRNSGVPASHIIDIALDDIANAKLRDALPLYEHIRERTAEEGTYYVFLDEIQYVEGFSDLVNGLSHRDNLDVYVTGSNSRFLSSDILTEFRGRGDELRVRPLAFAEFFPTTDKTADDAWRDYVTFGGMPQAALLSDAESKAEYLGNLFRKVYLTDIAERNEIKHSTELEELVKVLASSIGSLTSIKKIADTFTSKGSRGITDKTVKRYIDLIEEAFLIERTERFDIKGRRYIGNQAKYYFEDIGVRNAVLNFRQQEENHIMENIVFLELAYRGWSVDVGRVDIDVSKNGHRSRTQCEVDFVASKGSEKVYVQCAFVMPSDAKRQQEERPLLRIGDSFRKIIIIRDNINPWQDENGILTASLFDFLLHPETLGL